MYFLVYGKSHLYPILNPLIQGTRQDGNDDTQLGEIPFKVLGDTERIRARIVELSDEELRRLRDVSDSLVTILEDLLRLLVFLVPVKSEQRLMRVLAQFFETISESYDARSMMIIIVISLEQVITVDQIAGIIGLNDDIAKALQTMEIVSAITDILPTNERTLVLNAVSDPVLALDESTQEKMIAIGQTYAAGIAEVVGAHRNDVAGESRV